MLLSKVAPLLKGRPGLAQHSAFNVLSALAKRVPDALGPDWEQTLLEIKQSLTAQKGSQSSDGSQLRARCKSQRLAIEVRGCVRNVGVLPKLAPCLGRPKCSRCQTTSLEMLIRLGCLDWSLHRKSRAGALRDQCLSK